MFANSMIDSGSVCSVITKVQADQILKSKPSARCITTKRDKDLKTFSNEPINVLVKIATKVICNDWICEDTSLTVVDDGRKLIIWKRPFQQPWVDSGATTRKKG